jgi:hypothetical protein
MLAGSVGRPGSIRGRPRCRDGARVSCSTLMKTSGSHRRAARLAATRRPALAPATAPGAGYFVDYVNAGARLLATRRNGRRRDDARSQPREMARPRSKQASPKGDKLAASQAACCDERGRRSARLSAAVRTTTADPTAPSMPTPAGSAFKLSSILPYPARSSALRRRVRWASLIGGSGQL